MAITSAMATSFKSEMFAGGHCFNATVTPTGTTSSGLFTITSMSSTAGISVGMAITDTGNSGIPANAVVASIDSSTQITISKAATNSHSGTALSVSGDVIKLALIKVSAAGTYDAGSVNLTDITGNSDEVTGTGYSAGGIALTNVSPTTSGTTAFITFSPNPSWTSSTFSTIGCMIYNAGNPRNGGTSGTNTTGAGRACSVHDFGGTQSVTAGTFTVLMPAFAYNTAILRIN
jgi:hypothetical protein